MHGLVTVLVILGGWCLIAAAGAAAWCLIATWAKSRHPKTNTKTPRSPR